MRRMEFVQVWVLLPLVTLLLMGLLLRQDDRIRHLQARVDCLERPHGESSVTSKLGRDGKFHDATPIRTGCAP